MNIHTRLSSLPFPITDRQLAWIPMSAWAFTALSALLGIALAHFVGLLVWPAYRHERIAAFWINAPSELISAVFGFLVLWRITYYNSAIGTLWVVYYIVIKNDDAFSSFQWIRGYMAFWPAWLMGAILLVFEAPYTAGLTRRMYWQTPGNIGLFSSPGSGPVHYYLPTRLASAAIALLLAAVGIHLLPHLWHEWLAASRKNPAVFGIIGIFAIILLFTVADFWKQVRASGYAGLHAVLRLSLMLTIVGYYFCDYYGVKRGYVVKCNWCRQPKLVWQTACPHCNKNMVSSVPRTMSWLDMKVAVKTDPLAFGFRVVLPIWLLFTLLLTYRM